MIRFTYQKQRHSDEFLHALQVLAPRFLLCGTFIPKNSNAGGSARCIHKDLLPDDAMATHVVTCQGCDHIRSGCRSLVVVNVHFEHELTLRILRERLCLITPHWPQYPDAIARSWVTSVFANHRKKGSMFGIRHSLMEIREKLPSSIPFSLTYSKLPSLTLQERLHSPWACTHAVQDR